MKKGQVQMTFNIGAMIPRMIFIIGAVLATVMLIKHFLLVNIDVAEAEGQILINRFIYSPDCVSFRDKDLGSTHAGIIDLERFNSEVLDECIFYGDENNYASAKLTLYLLDTGEDITAYYNQKGYEIWVPLLDMEGSGGSKSFQDFKYVFVRTNDELRRAILGIEVVTPNY